MKKSATKDKIARAINKNAEALILQAKLLTRIEINYIHYDKVDNLFPLTETAIQTKIAAR